MRRRNKYIEPLEESDHALHQLVLLDVAAADLLHREPKCPLRVVDDVAVEQIAVALEPVLMSGDVGNAAVDFEDLVNTREIGVGLLGMLNMPTEPSRFLGKHLANGFGNRRLAHIDGNSSAYAGKVGWGKCGRQIELAHRERIGRTRIHLGAQQQVSVGDRAAHWPEHAPRHETRCTIWSGTMPTDGRKPTMPQ
jgi:hypothetical protein